MQLPKKKNLSDAEMVHHAELIVGERAPRIVDRDRAGGLAARGVALVHGDHAEVALELLRDVDHRARPDGDGRVQPAAGRRQQREARADLGVADADAALLVESDLGARRQSRNGPGRRACANTCGAALAAAAAAPVVRTVRRLELIIGYLPCRCRGLACERARHLSRRDSSRNFERYFIVPQIKPVGRGSRGRLRAAGAHLALARRDAVSTSPSSSVRLGSR